MTARVDGREESECLKDLLLSIKGTMSDWCEVMKKFNCLFAEYRDNVLKANVLSDDEKLWTKLENHFCFLHIIINLGDDATKRGLFDLDKCCLSEDAYDNCHKRGNSTTYTAIYVAARLFHQQGSEQYGKSGLFEAFLKDDSPKNTDGVDIANEDLGDARTGVVEMERAQISGSSRKGTQKLAKVSGFERDTGNRAHITYHDGTTLWYHRNDIKNFVGILKGGGGKGEMLNIIEQLLHSKVPLAGARALGIIKACITGPFQAAFDKMSNNILDMIPCCVQLRAAFQEFSADAHDLLNQPRSVFPDIEMHTDKMTEALYVNTRDQEMDALTLIAIQLILSNHFILFERQAEMYLPGGEHAEVGKDKEIMRNCSLTNRGCESNMGLLDREVQMRPNATPGYLSASVIVKSGGLAGINDVTDEEKGRVFDVTRRYASDCIEENKKKLAMYIAGQKAVLRQRQQSNEDKEKRLVKSKSKIISHITKYGGEWKSRSDVEKYLGERRNDSEAVAAIECQLCYHRVILQAKKILPKDKHDLFVIKGNNLQKLKKNLITLDNHHREFSTV